MEAQATKVRTGLVRFSYASLIEPREFDGSTFYQADLIIPKKDTKTLDNIKKAIQAAKVKGEEKWPGKFKVDKYPLLDGDIEKPDQEEYSGCYFIRAKSKSKPGLIDANKERIYDPKEFYSGVYGRASVNFYPYNVSGNKGVAVGLNNAQKLVNGPSLSSIAAPEEDFDDLDDIDIDEENLPF